MKTYSLAKIWNRSLLNFSSPMRQAVSFTLRQLLPDGIRRLNGRSRFREEERDLCPVRNWTWILLLSICSLLTIVTEMLQKQDTSVQHSVSISGSSPLFRLFSDYDQLILTDPSEYVTLTSPEILCRIGLLRLALWPSSGLLKHQARVSWLAKRQSVFCKGSWLEVPCSPSVLCLADTSLPAALCSLWGRKLIAARNVVCGAVMRHWTGYWNGQ
jgi:hypothetical protein